MKEEFGSRIQESLTEEMPRATSEKFTAWNFGDLEEVMEIQRGGQTLVGYPALLDAGDGVTLQVFDSPERAREVHRAGVRRLLAIAFRERAARHREGPRRRTWRSRR